MPIHEDEDPAFSSLVGQLSSSKPQGPNAQSQASMLQSAAKPHKTEGTNFKPIGSDPNASPNQTQKNIYDPDADMGSEGIEAGVEGGAEDAAGAGAADAAGGAAADELISGAAAAALA
jgi:hypothetical protein